MTVSTDGSEWLTGETGRLIKARIRGKTSGWTHTGKSGPVLKELFEYVKGRDLNYPSLLEDLPLTLALSQMAHSKWTYVAFIGTSLWSKRLNGVTIKVQNGPTYHLSQTYQMMAKKYIQMWVQNTFLYFVNDRNFANASIKIKQIISFLIFSLERNLSYDFRKHGIEEDYFSETFMVISLFWRSAAEIPIHFNLVYNHIITMINTVFCIYQHPNMK